MNAQWPSEEYLADHFALHRLDTVTHTVDEYDQSARYAIAHGVRFTYWEAGAQETRVGYYDEDTQLLTLLDPTERTIISHFRPDAPDYVRNLPQSTYR